MSEENRHVNRTSSLFNSPNDGDSDSNSFDPNDAKYLCCCGLLHSSTGVKIITILLDIALIFLLIRLIFDALEESKHEAQSLIFRCFIVGPHAISLTYAVWNENAGCMIPFMTLQIVGLFVGFLQVIALIYISITEVNTFHDVSVMYHIIVYTIIIILQIWFITIVISTWRYYCDKRQHGARTAYTNFTLIRPTPNLNNTNEEENCYELENMNVETISKVEIYDSESFL
uniref:Uncharacterized protein n=1 Tax=Parastrongyloides trichosuri TaxID=131310 RepID=A0A0N5A203_PARTI